VGVKILATTKARVGLLALSKLGLSRKKSVRAWIPFPKATSLPHSSGSGEFNQVREWTPGGSIPMLLMSLVALIALTIIIVLSMFFAGRVSARRAQARERIDAEITTIQKRSLEADQKLVQAVLSGTDVNTALGTLFRERSSLLSIGPSDEPWKWSADDLEEFREASVERHHEAIGRRALLPAVSSILLVIIATAGVLIVLYPASTEQHPETPRSASIPTAPVQTTNQP